MNYKLARLISVLTIAALLLILALLVANVTSCAPLTPESAVAASTTPTVQPIHDGTIYHPYDVDASPYGNVDTWDVLTVKGHEKWRECETVAVIHPGDYILYHNQEYQVSGINYKALTMSAVIMGN